MTIIAPIVIPDGVLHHRQVSDVVPFTYRSGITYQALLEQLRVYVGETLTTYFTTEFGEITEAWDDDLNTIVALVNAQLTATIEQILAGTNVPLNDATILQVLSAANSQSFKLIDSLYGGAIVSPRPSGADDSDALIAWLAKCANTRGVLRPETYTVTKPLTLPANSDISAQGAVLNVPTSPGGAFKVVTFSTGAKLRGLSITSAWETVSSTALYASNVDGIGIHGVKVNKIAGKGIWLDRVTNFLITQCAVSQTLEQGINLDFCSYGRVTENSVDTAQHGIQFWGGDSGIAAQYNGPAKAHHLTISDNVVKNGNTDGVNQVSAGIWGSLGRHIAITGNVVENWNDYCIDLEGCFDSIVSGNSCREGKNGLLGVNNGSKRCVFDANSCVNDVQGGPGFRADWGSIVTYASTDIKVTNNYFRTLLAAFTNAYRNDQSGGSIQRSVFSDNVIEVHSGTDLYAGLLFVLCNEMSIERNRLTIDGGQSGIRTIGCSNGEIAGNKVLTLNAGPGAASSGGGISLEYFSDMWKARNNNVRNNTVRGFNWGMYDKVGSDPGYNLFDGNVLNQIVHNDNGSYAGKNGTNFNEQNPTNPAGFVQSNG